MIVYGLNEYIFIVYGLLMVNLTQMLIEWLNN
jgi:hypothetical protein